MPKNRLNLNFQLESAAERTAFVEQYLNEIEFKPTAEELETIGNYILWGKNERGQNAQQEGAVKIKEWAPEKVESLEGLLETPGFTETSVRAITAPGARTPRIVFDRAAALRDAPEWMRPYYEALFRQIDMYDLIVTYYDLWTGKRKLPPRASLLARFTDEEAKALNEKALKLSQYKYLKLKHLLVDLRAEQYTFKDTYTAHVLSRAQPEGTIPEEHLRVGEDVRVLPLGLINPQDSLSLKIFNKPRPGEFTRWELREISQLLWSTEQVDSRPTLDFRNPMHVLNLYNARADLRDGALIDPYQIYGAAASIIQTLEYYEQRAKLTPLQKDLLEMKMKFKQNSEIASYLNKTYHKSYNDNYISTIFHQKVIPSIANAAVEHREIMENIFFPENFKKCKDCGEMFLLNSQNFVRQKKSADGFSPRCKACERKKRSRYR